MDDLSRLVHSKKRRNPANSRSPRVDGDGPAGPGTGVAVGPVEGAGGRDHSPLRASSGVLGRTEAAPGTDLPGELRSALRGKTPGRGRAVAEPVGEGGGLPLG